MSHHRRIIKPDGKPMVIPHHTNADGWQRITDEEYDRLKVLDGLKFLTCDAYWEVK